MNTLTPIAGISASVMLILLLGGCSSTKTPGEIMMSQGEGTAEIAEQWFDGEKLVAKGEKLVKKGKSKVDDGKDMIDDGDDMISKGQSMMHESEEAYRLRGKTQLK